jgi:hypothetical protein
MPSKEHFIHVRRVYRIACRMSPLQDPRAVEMRVAATSAMRAVTGRWDCCEPFYRWWDQFERPRDRRSSIAKPHVAAACTRFLKTH